MFKTLKYLLNILIILVGIPIIAWVCGFFVFAAHIASIQIPDVKNADSAIVLTGGTNRVSAGLNLLGEEKIKNLLISGVGKNTNRQDIIKEANYKKNLPNCCITLGHQAENTIGNAKEAQKFLFNNKSLSTFVVTSNYHIPRALLELNHAAPKINFIPYPVQPDKFSPDGQIFWRLSFLEYHKYLMTAFRIHMFPHEQQPIPEVFTK